VKLNKVKETYLIGGLVIGLVALLSWFFLVSPRMAQAGEIGERTVATQEKNATSERQIVTLTKLKNGLVDERAIAQALARKFPPTADQATLLRQIMTAATAAGIPERNVTALGPAAPILGGSSGSAKLPGGGATPATGDEGKSSAATKPAAAAESLATMTVAFNAKGSFQQVVDMLKKLEDLPRAFLITQVNLSSAETNEFTIAVQGNMYVHRAITDPESPAVAPTPAPNAT
jgi:Tfp pilus assembly protein PilO